mgnify:CR=1 FL=1
MKGQKIISMITILACIIALIGGVMGMNYVSDQKEIKTKEGDKPAPTSTP